MNDKRRGPDITFDFVAAPEVRVARSGSGWLMLSIDGTELHFYSHSGASEEAFRVQLLAALEGAVVETKRRRFTGRLKAEPVVEPQRQLELEPRAKVLRR